MRLRKADTDSFRGIVLTGLSGYAVAAKLWRISLCTEGFVHPTGENREEMPIFRQNFKHGQNL